LRQTCSSVAQVISSKKSEVVLDILIYYDKENVLVTFKLEGPCKVASMSLKEIFNSIVLQFGI
jgi:hypothetical protein